MLIDLTRTISEELPRVTLEQLKSTEQDGWNTSIYQLIVEGLINLDQVPTNRCFFGALPLKIHRGDGCPCRAFASTEPLSC